MYPAGPIDHEGRQVISSETGRSCAFLPFFFFFFRVCLSFFLSCLIVIFFQESPGCSRHPTRRQVRQATSESHCSTTSDSCPPRGIPCLLHQHSHALILPPLFTQVLTVLCRPALRVFFVIYEGSGCAIGATSLRTHLAAKENWLSNGVLPFVLALMPVSGFSWSAAGTGQR